MGDLQDLTMSWNYQVWIYRFPIVINIHHLAYGNVSYMDAMW